MSLKTTKWAKLEILKCSVLKTFSHHLGFNISCLNLYWPAAYISQKLYALSIAAIFKAIRALLPCKPAKT